jgi:hypothetical protein
MEVNKLRIGNWIEIGIEKGKVIEISQDNCLKININNKENISAPNERFDPIPLTKEWLEKFGFVMDTYCYFHLDDIIGKFDILMDDDKFFALKLCKIKYVHQLQNLYFALTGEELKIQNQCKK